MTTHARALILSSAYGTEADEIRIPAERLRDSGVHVTVATPEGTDVATLVSDNDPGPTISADTALSSVTADGYDVLVLPGGTLNADSLRLNQAAIGLIDAFAQAGKPIAAVCHAPWLVIEAQQVAGKKLTSYPSVKTDAINAGAEWVDEEVVVDSSEGYVLITSRTPKDLEAFSRAILEIVG